MKLSHHDWKDFVLLLIDMQQDFWNESMAQNFPHFSDNIERLLNYCRTEGIEVVHLRASFKADMSDWMVKYKLRGHIPCIQGTPGIKTLPFAVENTDETVILKQTFDGFQNPQLIKNLKEKGKRFILVAGLITSTCVLFTAASAAQNGFLVTVIDDCCADEPAAHEQTLDLYKWVFTRVKVERISVFYDDWKTQLNNLDKREN